MGGGVVNGVAAQTSDEGDKRKTLAAIGVITTGVGTLALGTAAALALSQRATAHSSTAADQEYAAAVLANDQAGETAWSKAWSACVSGEGAEAAVRPEHPETAFAFDAGTAGDSADGGSDTQNGETDPKAGTEDLMKKFGGAK